MSECWERRKEGMMMRVQSETCEGDMEVDTDDGD
eukprot:COSAG06_NODE_3204_length_5688_cov_11.682233_8_plen_34_part_00